MLPLIFLTIENEEQSKFMVDIYDTYYPLLKTIAIEHVYNSNDVEDVIQATFISLIKKVDLLQTLECYVLRVYIVKTIEHKCVDFNRRKMREKSRISEETLDDVSEFISSDVDTEALAMLNIEYEELGRYMMKIPEKLRQIILWKYVYGYDDLMIAKEMNISKDSVRVYLSRGRKALAAVAAEEARDET